MLCFRPTRQSLFRHVRTGPCCGFSYSVNRSRIEGSGSQSTGKQIKRLHTSDAGAVLEKGRKGNVIFSGIQPTGVPHLGNYLGALKPWVEQQNRGGFDAQIYSIVDLHSLTSEAQTGAERATARREGFAALLACGLDPEQSIIFYQSQNPHHAEMHWILSNISGMSTLTRMTQWKSKIADMPRNVDEPQTAEPEKIPWLRQENDSVERLRLGLFSYPVLQAADILLYRATHVPVGEDQVQHIEFARFVANRFNHLHKHPSYPTPKYILRPPEAVVSPAKRIMSLTEPRKKMSKSHPDAGSRILLSDSEDVIRKKLRAAKTDSENRVWYDPATRPGVSNLIEIIVNLEPGRTCQDVAKEVDDMQITGSKMKILKERAADLVNEEFKDIRERYVDLLQEKNQQLLQKTASLGQRKAAEISGRTMNLVRKSLGIYTG